MPDPVPFPPGASLGIVAGRGELPVAVARGARQAGVRYLGVVAVQEDAAQEIAALADHVDWLHPGQLDKAIKALLRQDIHHAIFAGQVTPGRLFTDFRPDWRAVKLFCQLRERNAETMFSSVAAEFEKDGVHVLSSVTFLGEAMATPGVMGRTKPTKAQQSDVELGWRLAREVSRLNIGQTVVVRKGTILAVEGFEGTDLCIRRGGELGHGDVVVVKVAKPRHDMRFDVPCVGMNTFESLQVAGAKVLAVQAGATIVLGKDTMLAACDRAGIAVVGVAPETAPCP